MIGLHTTFSTAMRIGGTCALAIAAYLQPYRPMMFVGRSMEPTYLNHSIVLTKPVREDQLKSGQVVVINMDSGPIVKRIAFVPGDLIVQAHFSYGWSDLIYVRPKTKRSLIGRSWRYFKVPAGQVYVLGDNQEVSYDSKQFGCVSTSRIQRILVDQRPFDMFPNSHRLDRLKG